ncbi:EmrB/QacA subfamily drug resistance transporter [Kitasatospora sp. MAA4]|uniref:MDR family MFS transporter n=1 Tax=Kitasatospora sp. MAA4 TaxID=3035093 RepID=UPI0024740E87|nr:MDR family MFS transporter [Kitasatospora sp. MAA4]MDH6133038.1 EmrB/QacA subfamily drug resistance transporter [Kitasatospora sp. MAA4]
MTTSSAAADAERPMTHREILEALSGLLLGLFVAVLSSTIVSNALPTILTDLHGGESAYTWVITAALLSLTASTPIWGKLSDLVSKKLLVQIALVIYIVSSTLAGLSQNTGELIGCRVLQGLGAGGVVSLAQICLASMVPPRERGRYSGYFGAVFALATIGGPLIGGVIVDTGWLGWRWCFYVGIPFSLIAIVVLQRTLHLPVVKRKAKIDYLGATLIAAAVSLLMVWVTLAGTDYPWLSWQTAAMVGGGLALGALAVLTESRAAEPIIPLHLFRYRTVSLAALASVLVGVGMYGATTFLSQYFQLAREKTPTMAGIMTLPMILGLALASTVAGRLITKYGKWKRFLVAGTFLLAVGFGLLGTVRADTPYWQLSLYMAAAGLGLGLTMQNLVLAVQNTVPVKELGTASSLVTFFRTMGGAMGVSALGALLGTRVTHYLTQNLAAAHIPAAGGNALGGGAIPDLHTLPAPLVPLVTDAFGHGVGTVFLVAAPLALASFLVVLAIREVPLRTAHTAPAPQPAEPVAEPVA